MLGNVGRSYLQNTQEEWNRLGKCNSQVEAIPPVNSQVSSHFDGWDTLQIIYYVSVGQSTE